MVKTKESVLPPIVMQVDSSFSAGIMRKYSWTFASEKRVVLQHKQDSETHKAIASSVVLSPQINVQQTIQPLHLNIIFQHLSFAQMPLYKQQLLVSPEEVVQRKNTLYIQSQGSQKSLSKIRVNQEQSFTQQTSDQSNKQAIINNELSAAHYMLIKKSEQKVNHIEFRQKQVINRQNLLHQITRHFSDDKLSIQLQQQSQFKLKLLDNAMQQYKHVLHNQKQMNDQLFQSFVSESTIVNHLVNQSEAHQIDLQLANIEHHNVENTQVSDVQSLRNSLYINKISLNTPIRLTNQQYGFVKLFNNTVQHPVLIQHRNTRNQDVLQSKLIHQVLQRQPIQQEINAQQSSVVNNAIEQKRGRGRPKKVVTPLNVKADNIQNVTLTTKLLLNVVKNKQLLETIKHTSASFEKIIGRYENKNHFAKLNVGLGLNELPIQGSDKHKQEKRNERTPLIYIRASTKQKSRSEFDILHELPLEQVVERIAAEQQQTNINIKNEAITREVAIKQVKKSQINIRQSVIKQALTEQRKLVTTTSLTRQPIEQITQIKINRKQTLATLLIQREQQLLHSQASKQDNVSTVIKRQAATAVDSHVRLHIKEQQIQKNSIAQQQVVHMQTQLKKLEEQLERHTEGIKQSSQAVDVKKLTNQVYDELSRKLKFEKQRLGR